MQPTGSKPKCWWPPHARRWAAALGCLVPLMAPAVPVLVPEYRVGETARVDVVAPAELVAIDPVTTSDLRNKEIQRIPNIYRYDSNAVILVVSNFNVAFASNRENFRLKLGTAFKETSLSARQIASPRFAKIVASFRNNQRMFPITTNLAERWARNLPDEYLLDSYRVMLRAEMARHIRPDSMTAAERPGGYKVRLISPEAARDLDSTSVETSGFLIVRNDLMPLNKARTDFQKSFAKEERALGTYLAGFMQPNCTFEENLTRQVRAQKTNALWSASRYEPGQFIVRRGEVIDAKSKAALDRLRADHAANQLREQAAASGRVADWKQGFFWGAVVIAATLLGVLIFNRSRRHLPLLPARTEPPSADGAAAERYFFLAQMARWLSHSAVCRLFWQRQQLLQTQETSAATAEDIEKRLALVQQHTLNRFQAYEERIAQLEKDLAATEVDKRDLIRAKLQLAREELETQQSKSRLTMN